MKKRSNRTAESGFTLAGLLVILTIISVIVAYTVPEQWSLVMRRERERQTIFLMKQYARAIWRFQQKHQGTLPTSLDQLREARDPRLIRGGEWPLPLTGREKDWILVPREAVIPPAGIVLPGGGAPPGGQAQQPGTPPTGSVPGAGTNPPPPAAPMPGTTGSRLNPAASPPDYNGPFVGVRPRATGKSLIALHGAEDYGEWVYTVDDLIREMQMRQMMYTGPR